MKISKQLIEVIKTHAAEENPRECCGLIIKTEGGREYVRCRNDSAEPEKHFRINRDDACSAEDRGEILAIVHSHPDRSATPSMADRVQCEAHEVPWLIVSPVDEQWLNPNGYTAPLLGREFCHGVLDCYSLVKDFYARELNIELPDFERNDLWWESQNGPSLYAENFEKAGFYRVDEPQYGDMLVMRIKSPGRPCFHPNHAGIYLGGRWQLRTEETPAIFGNPLFLHHLYGRLSAREMYTRAWAERTELILRHKEVAC